MKTIKEFAERIKNYYRHQRGYVKASMVVYYIEQLEKDIIACIDSQKRRINYGCKFQL